jgi:hypothetical protein
MIDIDKPWADGRIIVRELQMTTADVGQDRLRCQVATSRSSASNQALTPPGRPHKRLVGPPLPLDRAE